MNRLASEKSPYLLMHAQNPVDWYPWDEQALAQARSQDKMVFLSIGYSACHWCHVIARESFEDEEVAAVLNDHFISIKVDKEEQPHVDQVYMDAVELATGAGGWPMTLLLTPQGAPFFAATYLPKEALLQILRQAQDMWMNQRPALMEAAEDFTRRMEEAAHHVPAPKTPDEALLKRAVGDYKAACDRRWGGFGRAPKFPAAHNLLFLLAYFQRTGDQAALDMAEGALSAMYRGGIFDHVGGGFCRYSVDRMWLAPHFEKMLYDNALLLWAYALAWRVTQKPLYRLVARRTADYVLGEMTGPQGEFYCAQDADSQGREGGYYLFSRAELMQLLGDGQGERFCHWYGITQAGNFEGMNIPNRIGKAIDPQGDEALTPLRQRVYQYRRERMPLGRDDKVLTAWNALMIAALCQGAHLLDAPEYVQAARAAEAFLRRHLMDAQGDLMLRWREGEAKGQGVLADYGFYTLAQMALYEATGEQSYLNQGEAMAKRMIEEFSGGQEGGFYLYGQRAQQLIVRPREPWDGAMPSGNSCAALALWMLARHTQAPQWRQAARRQLRFVAGAAAQHPTGHGFALMTIAQAMDQGKGESWWGEG